MKMYCLFLPAPRKATLIPSCSNRHALISPEVSQQGSPPPNCTGDCHCHKKRQRCQRPNTQQPVTRVSTVLALVHRAGGIRGQYARSFCLSHCPLIGLLCPSPTARSGLHGRTGTRELCPPEGQKGAGRRQGNTGGPEVGKKP